MSLRALIVDDEQHARENLRLLLDEFCPEVQLLGAAASVVEAKAMIEEHHPQLLFLDIRMPAGTEGFELLAELHHKSFQVVFVTAFKDYAVQGFKANGILFLLKPLHIGDLRDVIEKVISREQILRNSPESREVYIQSLSNLTNHYLKNQPSRFLTLVNETEFKLLSVDHVRYLESSGNSTVIHCQDDIEHQDSRNLRQFEEMLDSNLFFRISRKHLVHLAEVKQLNERNPEGGVILKNGRYLAVIATRIPELQQAIKKFSS